MTRFLFKHLCHDTGIEFLVVTVGDRVNRREAEEIASDSSYVYGLQTESDTASVAQEIAMVLCA